MDIQNRRFVPLFWIYPGRPNVPVHSNVYPLNTFLVSHLRRKKEKNEMKCDFFIIEVLSESEKKSGNPCSDVKILHKAICHQFASLTASNNLLFEVDDDLDKLDLAQM